MKREAIKLQTLRGVGEILSARFVDAGYDTFGKVAAAGEEGLRKIPGVRLGMLVSIVAQAGKLAAEEKKARALKVRELKKQAASLKDQVQVIALSVRDRFKDEVSGKSGKKVEKEFFRIITSLEKVEGKLETRAKKAGRGLLKAEKRLAALGDANLKGIGKGLKKARNTLKRVYT